MFREHSERDILPVVACYCPTLIRYDSLDQGAVIIRIGSKVLMNAQTEMVKLMRVFAWV